MSGRLLPWRIVLQASAVGPQAGALQRREVTIATGLQSGWPARFDQALAELVLEASTKDTADWGYQRIDAGVASAWPRSRGAGRLWALSARRRPRRSTAELRKFQ